MHAIPEMTIMITDATVLNFFIFLYLPKFLFILTL